MAWKRNLGLGCGGLLAIIASGIAYFLIAKPWIPPIEVSNPGPDGIKVDEKGLLAHYFAPSGDGIHPAILMLGGSEGGMTQKSDNRARELAKLGYAVLYQGYYRAPGQPKKLENVPLENFDRGISWLQAQKNIDPARLAIIGGSKGAEAALIAASRNPAVKAVVAGMPSNVAWQGIDWEGMIYGAKVGGSWSLNGKSIPYLPYVAEGYSPNLVDMYNNSLKKLSDHPDAEIPVENIKGPILLICGEADTLWPSCSMARLVETRAHTHSGPKVTILSYKDAGHAVFGPPIAKSESDYDKLDGMGGTDAGNAQARIDSWPKMKAFLSENLKPGS